MNQVLEIEGGGGGGVHDLRRIHVFYSFTPLNSSFDDTILRAYCKRRGGHL